MQSVFILNWLALPLAFCWTAWNWWDRAAFTEQEKRHFWSLWAVCFCVITFISFLFSTLLSACYVCPSFTMSVLPSFLYKEPEFILHRVGMATNLFVRIQVNCAGVREQWMQCWQNMSTSDCIRVVFVICVEQSALYSTAYTCSYVLLSNPLCYNWVLFYIPVHCVQFSYYTVHINPQLLLSCLSQCPRDYLHWDITCTAFVFLMNNVLNERYELISFVFVVWKHMLVDRIKCATATHDRVKQRNLTHL